MQQMFEWINDHMYVYGLVLLVLAGSAVLILAVDTWRRNKKRKNDKRLQRLYFETEEELRKARAEIKHLKSDLFAAREDGKISVAKKDEEIKQLMATIHQLETDKKQLSKWGTEK